MPNALSCHRSQGKLTDLALLSPPLSPPRPAIEETEARVNRKDFSFYVEKKKSSRDEVVLTKYF